MLTFVTSVAESCHFPPVLILTPNQAFNFVDVHVHTGAYVSMQSQ